MDLLFYQESVLGYKDNLNHFYRICYLENDNRRADSRKRREISLWCHCEDTNRSILHMPNRRKLYAFSLINILMENVYQIYYLMV
jgi:hypothetical protein